MNYSFKCAFCKRKEKAAPSVEVVANLVPTGMSPALSVEGSYLKVHPDVTAIFTSNPEEYAEVVIASKAKQSHEKGNKRIRRETCKMIR